MRATSRQSGQVVRVAVFTTVRPDCTAGPLPTIRLVRAPEHGNLTVRKVKLSATNVKQCLAIEVPALAAYKSAAGFEGSDPVILEVRSAQGKTQLPAFHDFGERWHSRPSNLTDVARAPRPLTASFFRAGGTPSAGA